MGCNCRKKAPKKSEGEKMPKKKDNKDEPSIVWIKCRASRPCGSNTAVVTRMYKNNHTGPSRMAMHNRITHYKCTACGGSFTISV